MSYSDTRWTVNAFRETIGRDYGWCPPRLRLAPDLIAARESRREKTRGATGNRVHLFAIRSPRDSHTDAALARTPSLFRFASVASRPRFSHDPVNLAPDYDG